MNRYYFHIFISFFIVNLHSNIACMRSVNTKLPTFTIQNQSSSSSNQASRPIPATTVQIPIEQSNQALAKVIEEQQKEHQSQSKKSKWYRNQNIGLLGMGIGALQYAKKDTQVEDPDNRLYAKDAQIEDPELYALFLKIKEDMGITEDIPLLIANNHEILDTNQLAHYHAIFKYILITSDYRKLSPIKIIQILAHELEHARQFLHYTGSYPIPSIEELIKSREKGIMSPTGIHLKIETGADAQAAGYFDCPECLKNIQNQNYTADAAENPVEFPSGYFSSFAGYFGPHDYNSYIQRACQEGELCQAHKILGKPKKIGYSSFFKSGTKYDPYYAQIYDKNYLKEQYNKHREQMEKELPIDLYLPHSK